MSPSWPSIMPKGGLEAIYDRYRYLPEIRSALALWAAHVLAVVEGRAGDGGAVAGLMNEAVGQGGATPWPA